MPTPKIIEIDEERDVMCPICKTVVVDAEEGLVEQPSCPHIRFIYCNGECFEWAAPGLEARLIAEEEEADQNGDVFEIWDALKAHCDKDDLILEQVSEGLACGPVSFKVWIGIRGETKNTRSGCHLVGAFPDEFSPQDDRVFFRPTRVFVRWMKAKYGKKGIYEIGAGLGHASNLLAEAGLRVTALDLEPREESEFPVIQANSTQYVFEKGSVVLICRPCHNGFVRETVLRALTSGVSAIIYVGLRRNVRQDLGGYFRQFTQRRIKGIGHSDERIWEMPISRAQADACMRRGAIPPLSSDFSR